MEFELSGKILWGLISFQTQDLVMVFLPSMGGEGTWRDFLQGRLY